jgi:hypothetical protein
VNPYVVAAAAMLVAALPGAVVLFRGRIMAAVVAFEVVGSVVVMVLVLASEGFGRSGEFELPLLLSVLLFGSGLVFVRALERWL